MSSLHTLDHRPLFDLIQTRLALNLDEYRKADVLRVVEELGVCGNFRYFHDLIHRLSEQPTTQSIWQKLIQASTIGETYFFRDRNQFNALRDSILPSLIEQRRMAGQKYLRLWSAACSTGEEPYSLAMLLRDLIPDYSEWEISILGSDLNAYHLERAQAGLYRAWSFRTETPDTVRHWFTEEKGMYRINDSIRRMVTFMPLNLASDDYPSVSTRTMGMDLILCRNVLIYFDNPTAAAVIGRLERALGQDGWLVLGHAESAHVANQNFLPQSFENAVLFRKSEQPLPKRHSLHVPPETRGYTLSDLPQTRPLTPPPVRAIPIPVSRADQPDIREVATQEDPFEAAQQAANREQWEEALARLKEAEQKDKMCPQVHYLRGVVELQQGEIDKALKSLRQAIYCDSNFVLAYFLLGSIFEQEGQYRKALAQWSQALILLRYLEPKDMIAYSDGITVETLAAILEFRRGNLPVKL